MRILAAWFGNEKGPVRRGTRPKLGYKDSNLDKQIQRLLCYRYTIPQSETAHDRWALIPVKNHVAADKFAAAG
ncbi:MAG: hypothetical protein JWN40_6045 [Phycisphaerales bacterium]|nr:hypothetical protein [Phycisphaerales bacterium]